MICNNQECSLGHSQPVRSGGHVTLIKKYKHMKNILFSLFLLLFSHFLAAQKLIDKKATAETKALYTNLKTLSQKNILFGHQEDDAYGTTWNAVAGKSDVKDVCGSYPAVHGWDIGEEGSTYNVDGVEFANMYKWIKDVYDRGGVNTVSWHVDNPVNEKGAWDTTRAVKYILPGGKDHNKFLKRLDYVAEFLKNCKSNDVQIPIIFRPYHEHNGNWFWWGKGNCTEQEYIQMWRFTVDYLKNTKKLHHIIYAFSPDRSRMDLSNAKTSYLYGYPGDAYVDILGYDNYMDVGIKWNTRPKEEQIKNLIEGLKAVSQLAKEKNKVAAMTETGLEEITNPNWFTEVILNPIKSNPDIQLSYFLVWRNAHDRPNHYYAPYPGHSSVDDFMKFYNDSYTLFEADLKNIYKVKKP